MNEGTAARMRRLREAGIAAPQVEEEERAKAEAHAPLRPKLIHEIIREEGEIELSRPAGTLAWSGLASGLSMGFSFLTQSLLRGGLPDESWRLLIDSFGYSVGFIIVVLGRQQLFTESTLTAVLPLLTRRDRTTARAVGRMWAIVLATNLAGATAFAGLLLAPGLVSPATQAALVEVAGHAVAGPFGLTLIKAIFAGWLIALMVWLLPSAGSARILVILLLTYVVALGQFSHIIAGAVEAAFALFVGEATIHQYFFWFLVPTLLGNIIGGVSLVAVLNHAPLRPELPLPAADSAEPDA